MSASPSWRLTTFDGEFEPMLDGPKHLTVSIDRYGDLCIDGFDDVTGYLYIPIAMIKELSDAHDAFLARKAKP